MNILRLTALFAGRFPATTERYNTQISTTILQTLGYRGSGGLLRRKNRTKEKLSEMQASPSTKT
jgi:hypothetical protein